MARKIITETRFSNRKAALDLAGTLDRAKRSKSPEAALRTLRDGVGAILAEVDRQRPFATFGEQLRAIAKASQAPEQADPRLVRAPTGMNEGDPSAGGFLVQTTFIPGLLSGAYDEAVITPLCDRRQTDNPLAEVKIPAVDEISRADGSRWGGTLSYWAAEADSVSASRPRFRWLEFSAKKLVGLCYGTGELMNDAPMFDAYIRQAFAAEFGFKLDLAVLLGSGAGQPLGICNAPATIVVSKESGQASGTVVAANIRNMWKRLPAPMRKRAVWLVNEEVEDQLDQLSEVIGTAGAIPNWYQPAGANGSPYALLKGRPVIAVEQAPALGALGDIVLADLSRYILVDGGAEPMLSAHARFLNDEVVFRFVLRIDGAPSFASPVTPYNGTLTRSPFVTLEAR